MQYRRQLSLRQRGLRGRGRDQGSLFLQLLHVLAARQRSCGSRRAEKFRLLRGESDLVTYTFNKHVIKHRFCSHCGIQSFARGKDPSGNAMAAINIRCLEDFEFENVPVQHIDGKAF